MNRAALEALLEALLDALLAPAAMGTERGVPITTPPGSGRGELAAPDRWGNAPSANIPGIESVVVRAEPGVYDGIGRATTGVVASLARPCRCTWGQIDPACPEAQRAQAAAWANWSA